MHSRFFRILGLACWVACLVAGILWFRYNDSPAMAGRDSLPRLWAFLTGDRRTATMLVPEHCYLQIGDPIFQETPTGQLQQIGEVSAVATASPGAANEAVFYSTAPPLTTSSTLSFHQTPNSIEWVLHTMLPDRKREELVRLIGDAYQLHHQEILNLLRPVFRDSLREAIQVAGEELPAALRKRRATLEQIGARYQQETLEQELVPLIQDEIWPIVREHTEPELTKVGREIWEQASLWRFGWRYFYDMLPLTESELTRREWSRFVHDQALPVLKDHREDFLEIQRRVLVDVTRNSEVRAVVRRNLGKIVDDPELQQVVWEVVREAAIENPRVHAVMNEHWQREETQAAFRLAARYLEPTVVRIGDSLFGTPTTGVSPEFARVLRNQVFFKDKRWLVLHEGDRSVVAHTAFVTKIPVVEGSGFAPNPFVPDSEVVED